MLLSRAAHHPELDRTIVWPNAVAILAAGKTHTARSWAAHAALNLVSELERVQSNVVLVDLDGRDSVLSRILSVEGEEGITDVLLHRVPFSRIAKRPRTHSFFFVPASSRVDPPRTLLASREWGRIAKRFKRAGAHVVLYVPESRWTEVGSIDGFEHAIVLNGSGVAFCPEDCVVLEAIDANLPADTATADMDEDRRAAAVRLDEENGASTAREDTEDVTISLEKRSRGRGWRSIALQRPSSGRTGWRLAALIPAAVMFWLLIDSEARSEASAIVESTKARWTKSPQASDPPDESELADRLEPSAAEDNPPALGQSATAPASDAPHYPLPYAVQIAAYYELRLAVDKQAVFDAPGRPTYVVPVSGPDRIFYRLLAGPFAQQDQAERVQREITRRSDEHTGDAFVTEARWAFALETQEEASQALQSIEALSQKGIPAYTVATRDGFRIYAGGYAKRQQASYLASMLTRTGLHAELVEVVGVAEVADRPLRVEAGGSDE